MKVPVRNVYYLLCYAWDLLQGGKPESVSDEPFESMPELFARVLEAGVSDLLRRGPDRGYLPEADDLRGPRGKFDLSETVKRGLLVRPAVHCVFDSLRHDVLHNRILKSTLRSLARCPTLPRPLREGSLGLYRRLHDVGEVDLSPAVFARVVLHRNNRHYALLMEVCRILCECLLVDPRSGTTRFRNLLDDETQMSRVFERFVRNFYRREQNACRVRGGESVKWQYSEGTAEDLAYLPRMVTDVTLESASRKLVIDAKYYASTLQGHLGGGKVHSGNLYQLFAYLKNFEAATPAKPIEGMLLYPTVEGDLDLRYVLHGHKVRVATVDLSASWREIHARMLALIRE